MNNALKIFFRAICLIACTIAAVYVFFSVYYSRGFMFGTWINGIYCTGKSIDAVESGLSEQNEYSGITVICREGNSIHIAPSDISLQLDYSEPLKRYYDKQNPLFWGEGLFLKRDIKLLPDMTYDKDKYDSLIDSMGFATNEDKENGSARVTIIKSEKGYGILDETLGVPVKDKISSEIISSISNLESEIKLEDIADCYQDLDKTDAENSIVSTYDKIKKVCEPIITYKFGDEKVPVDISIVSDFLVTDDNIESCRNEKASSKTDNGSGLFIIDGKETALPESTDLLDENGFYTDKDGNLILSESAMYLSVDKLCKKYDTIGSERKFKTADGDTATVSGGTYGNEIDEKAEFDYLIKTYTSDRNSDAQVHEPEYTKTAFSKGSNDIGDTYVEIDLDEQRLYYFEGGKLIITTPVVTGNLEKNRDTPTGVYYIYYKQKNRTLKGRGYSSFVKYWMAVYKGIGIHDASWRSEFGGEIYVSGGSHGCINGPESQISKLYEMTEVGTPVILYSKDQ